MGKAMGTQAGNGHVMEDKAHNGMVKWGKMQVKGSLGGCVCGVWQWWWWMGQVGMCRCVVRWQN